MLQFQNSKKNNFHGNYFRKYGICFFKRISEKKLFWNNTSRYEFTLAAGFGSYPFFISKTILQTFYHANIDYLRNWRTFMLMYGIGSTIFFIVDACYNYLWINTFGLFPPIPFSAYTLATFSMPAMYATLWFRIPKSAREEKELQKRFIIFLVSQAYDVLLAWVYVYFTLLFIHIPEEYQPILGFVCSILREINQKILNFIIYRAGGGRHVKMGMFF